MASKKILIVDDEPVILDLLASLFTDGDVDVIACRSGKEALERMEQGGVDVLLTDKNLPDFAGGGLDLVRHARRITPDAEAIVITGYASLDTALRAMELVQPYHKGAIEPGFLKILAHAKSNLPEMGTGEDVFNRFVRRQDGI